MNAIHDHLEPDRQAPYHIVVRGQAGDAWTGWLGDVQVSAKGGLITIHAVVDQAGLRALVNRLWDLNLTLVAAVRVQDQPLHRE